MSAAAYAAHDPALWAEANRRLLEKAISELSYEGLIAPQQGEAAEGVTRFSLPAEQGGLHWLGRCNAWGQHTVRAGSVRGADGAAPGDAVAALATMLAPLALPPVTLGNYLRETLNTLFADAEMLAARRGLTAGDWLALEPERLQALLDGHPKAIPSKGRLGWSADDNRAYGPEAGVSFRLRYLAVHRSLAQPCLAAGWDEAGLLAAACDTAEAARLRQGLGDDYWLLPVHPWQWRHMIAGQFAGLLASRRLIDLGEGGDRYRAQQSLRTLCNVDRPHAANLKLPLSILNTSAYRGLPAHYLAITPQLSDGLQALLATDPLLAARNCQALAEPAAAFVPHPLYHGLAGVPYQFDEMLGAVWRQSTESRCGDGEQVLMAAVLQQLDDNGRPLVAEFIRHAGLSAEAWLSRLFDLAVIPLYHLQARYGLGFIAHGQNLMLRFAGHAPAGILLKDYQGDLFRADAGWETPPGLDTALWQALPEMPPHYLLHNLWTGLFASVFRFMASSLHDAGVYQEPAFYRLLAARLRAYQQAHPELAPRFAALDLFQAEMPRLSLNRARFAAGYGDTASRPIHALGPALSNPLCH